MWKGAFFIPAIRVNWNSSSHNGNLMTPNKETKKTEQLNFHKSFKTLMVGYLLFM
jgi:hypothetical protein